MENSTLNRYKPECKSSITTLQIKGWIYVFIANTLIIDDQVKKWQRVLIVTH